MNLCQLFLYAERLYLLVAKDCLVAQMISVAYVPMLHWCDGSQ